MEKLGLALMICGGLILTFAGFGLMFGGVVGAIVATFIALILSLPIMGIVLVVGKGKKE